jgi:ketosteroid isomerase-like protein
VKNAVERLWRALAQGDLPRADAELHDRVVLEWPHSGQRFEGREAFLVAHRASLEPQPIELLRVVTEGRAVAAEVTVERDGETWAVAAFYTVHDGRILHAVEYWLTTV